MNLTAVSEHDPAIALRFRDRQYAADLIGAAILEFDLFTYLAQQPGATLESLCLHFQWQPRPADVLLTLCRASGFIETGGTGQCRLTGVGLDYLTRSSPFYLGPYYKPIADSQVLRDFVQILKTGKPANWQAKSDGADWHESMKDPTFAADFTNLMNCRGIAFGQQLALKLTDELKTSRHLLDVGGGSGIYSTTMVARHPHMTATVLEQSPVDEIARAEIRKQGMSAQVSVTTADMFTDPWDASEPSGQRVDTILLSNLLHDWDVPEATQILQKSSKVLKSGDLLIIHGAILDEGKHGPLPVAEYSALLMNITQGKCYSVCEYRQMLEESGFAFTGTGDTTGDRGYVTARRC